MDKPFKHTVSSLKRFNKALTKRVRKQEKTLERMTSLAQQNRTLIDQDAKLHDQIANFDPYNPG
jgi:hypothetical protein